MTSGKTWVDEFPGNFVWSNATLVTKGMAPYGAVALAEIDEVCERLRPRQGEPHAWAEEWSAMGRRLEGVAATAAAESREMSAGSYYLRAGMYYFTAERFVPPGEEKRAIGKKALEQALRSAWLAAQASEDLHARRRLDVPCAGRQPPGGRGLHRRLDREYACPRLDGTRGRRSLHDAHRETETQPRSPGDDLAIVAVLASRPATALEVGQPAPGFTLPATTGGDISLNDFRGKKFVLVEFSSSARRSRGGSSQLRSIPEGWSS